MRNLTEITEAFITKKNIRKAINTNSPVVRWFGESGEDVDKGKAGDLEDELRMQHLIPEDDVFDGADPDITAKNVEWYVDVVESEFVKTRDEHRVGYSVTYHCDCSFNLTSKSSYYVRSICRIYEDGIRVWKNDKFGSPVDAETAKGKRVIDKLNDYVEKISEYLGLPIVEVSTQVDEAFINKSNIEKARKANSKAWEPGGGTDLMTKIFKSVTPNNAELLRDTLDEVGLLPDGNIFTNKRLWNISWSADMYDTMAGPCYTVGMYCKMDYYDHPDMGMIRVTMYIPVWFIHKYTMELVRQDNNRYLIPEQALNMSLVKSIVNKDDCEENPKAIEKELVDLTNDIAEYLKIKPLYEKWKI